ncbi:MAG: type IV toxin-antitoxin system AbiEi family antitoxin domain-containing protein [Thermoleophilaceae bacterium]
MGGQLRTVEQTIAGLTARSYGVASRAELVEAGISAPQIDRRVLKGALVRVYRAVYRAGPPSTDATYMAAVKACGEGAALSGLAAAYRMGLVRRRRAPEPEVSALTDSRVGGLVTHRCRRVERWTFDSIPTTTVARTLVDIAARLDDEELALAFHEARGRYRTTPGQVEQVLDHRPGSPGANKLRRAMRGETHVSLSALERKFLARLKEANLLFPDETNQYAGSKKVDCRWLKQKLTVELDSYTFHSSRHSWEQDRKREREAYARGDHFRRYTWGDVFEHPQQMLEELTELLP